MKIVSETKKERIERNKAMVAYYKKAMRGGSDKTAVYDKLAKKHNLSKQHVCAIINAYLNDEENKPK